MSGLDLTLRRASYEGAEFPCVDLRDVQGHDSVQHTAYRVDGASIEWVGRKPVRISMKAALINGLSSWPADTFPGLHDQLEALFKSTPQGRLQHPYYGEVFVQVDSWTRGFDPRLQSGCYLEIEFTEIDATAFTPEASQRFAPDPATEMESVSAAADAAVLAVAPNTQLDATAAIVTAKLAYLEEDERAAAEAYGTLDEVQDAVSLALNHEDLEGIEAHDARGELRALSAATWRYAEAYAGPRTGAQTYETPAELSLAEIAATVYGDPSLAYLLRSANILADECFVPLGTVLVVPRADG